MDETVYTPDVSIVVPAFNEEKRLPAFLDRIADFCAASSRRYEIIVVDDGSADKTAACAGAYRDKFRSLRVIALGKNSGKGYAVKRGLMDARGAVAVFLDADGSVEPGEIEKNLHYIADGSYDIFIGSRAITREGSVVKTLWYRRWIGIVFNFLVHTMLFKNVKDTQCGFKIFRREVIMPLFSRGYLTGFGFDIEILYLAHKMGYRVKEGPVSWKHVKESKINLITDSARMFWNILQVRFWHCVPINTGDKYMGPDEYRYMYDLENHHWWFIARKYLALSLIRSLRKTQPRILDIGTGTGGNLTAFSEAGTAYGVDISAQAVEFCRKRGLKNITRAAAENVGYADKTFDVIMCLDLLEHVSHPREVLLELKRVLKDDGKIIIMVPAFRFLWSQHDEALCHLRRYDHASLVGELHEASLVLDRDGYFFLTSFFFVAPIRIMRRFFASKKKARSDTSTLPPAPLNELLKRIFYLEAWISNKVRLPFGTTLYAIVSKGG